jgi:glycogen operon protein
MTEENWREGFARSVGLYLDGGSIAALTARGEAIVDDRFYVLCNAHHEALEFTLPHADWGRRWSLEVDTASSEAELPLGRVLRPGDQVHVEGRAVVVLRCARKKEDA